MTGEKKQIVVLLFQTQTSAKAMRQHKHIESPDQMVVSFSQCSSERQDRPSTNTGPMCDPNNHNHVEACSMALCDLKELELPLLQQVSKLT